MALMARGHADSLAVLDLVHTLRCLALLMRAWRDWLAVALCRDARQPFFSVWPVRTLDSDVESTNFVARLSFYAVDKSTPLMADSWNPVNAGADAPPRAPPSGWDRPGTAGVFCCSRSPGHRAGAAFMGS